MLASIEPGGHAVVWSLPRTSHWTATAWEDGGFEVRDQVVFLFGSGFPKSLNCGNGVGTALKPSHEDWWLLRKPIDGTVAKNIEKYGTGGINIDACRISTDEKLQAGSGGMFSHIRDGKEYPNSREGEASADRRYSESGGTRFTMTLGNRGGDPKGRFPANVILDDSEEVEAIFPITTSGTLSEHHNRTRGKSLNTYGVFANAGNPHDGDTGSASRFFYHTKCARADRNDGLSDFDKKDILWSSGTKNPGSFQAEGTDRTSANNHPTVKSTGLMRYLVKLVTPKGGVVLDPFTGSGSTGKAAILEGFNFIGIEREAEYVEIARARIKHAGLQPRLF